MNPTVTIFYDGKPEDLEYVYRSPKPILIPEYEKDGKRYWATKGIVTDNKILVGEPIHEKDDLKLAAFKKILERWLSWGIENLVCFEVCELTSSTCFGEDTVRLMDDIMAEFSILDKLNITMYHSLDSILKAEGEEIAKILNSAIVHYPHYGGAV